jgi:hypothetical protein
MRSLVTPAILPSFPDIVSQFNVMTLLGRFSLLIIFLPIVPILIRSLYLLIHHRLNYQYLKIIFLISATVSVGLMWFVLTFIAPIGFGERTLFMAQLLLGCLSAISLIEIMKFKKGKIIYLVVAILFTCVIIISPVTNRSDYAIVHYGPITSTDVKSTDFMMTYSIVGQQISGDPRICIDVVSLFDSFGSLHYSQAFIDNARSGNLTYSSSQLIIVNNGTPHYLSACNVEGSDAITYIDKLYGAANLIYSNKYSAIFSMP